MSEIPIELPQLEPPARLQGKDRDRAIKALLKQHGESLYQDAVAIRRRERLTVDTICQLALEYRIQLRVVCDYLETRGIFKKPDAYNALFGTGRKLRPVETLKRVWAEMQKEVAL